jgi:hypothetical protein
VQFGTVLFGLQTIFRGSIDPFLAACFCSNSDGSLLSPGGSLRVGSDSCGVGGHASGICPGPLSDCPGFGFGGCFTSCSTGHGLRLDLEGAGDFLFCLSCCNQGVSCGREKAWHLDDKLHISHYVFGLGQGMCAAAEDLHHYVHASGSLLQHPAACNCKKEKLRFSITTNQKNEIIYSCKKKLRISTVIYHFAHLADQCRN